MKMKFSPPLHSSEVGEASKEGRAGDIVLVPRPTWASITPPPPTSLRISRLCPSGRDGVLSKLFLLNSRSTKTGVQKSGSFFLRNISSLPTELVFSSKALTSPIQSLPRQNTNYRDGETDPRSRIENRCNDPPLDPPLPSIPPPPPLPPRWIMERRM